MSHAGAIRTNVAPHLPGLALAAVIATAGFVASWKWAEVSPLTVSLVVAVVIANLGLVPTVCETGLKFAGRQILRAGIVLLGLQLSFDEVVHLGGRGFIAVACVVVITFSGTRLLAHWLGVSPGLGLLTATGYSICGVSAISAMVGAVEGDEEDATYAIALVTLFGSVSIFVLPFIGHIANAGDVRFGMWSGAAVHDVAQVVATATAFSSASLAPAIIVKLTRVLLLAPLVTATALRRRANHETPGSRVTLLPLFIVLFLAMVVVRSTGIPSPEFLSAAKHTEKAALALALVGLGTGVRLSNLRVLGARPVVLGASAWVLVMVSSSVAIRFLPLNVVG